METPSEAAPHSSGGDPWVGCRQAATALGDDLEPAEPETACGYTPVPGVAGRGLRPAGSADDGAD